jgi:uroporphyrinogen-III synthase
MKILLTRPYNLALNSRDKIVNLGKNPDIIPLIKIKYLNEDIIDDDFQYIILTSQNSALLFQANAWMKEKVILTVGEATKNLLMQLSCKNILLCEKDVSSLINAICRTIDKNSNILYICGDHLSCDLKEELKYYGYDNINSQVIYKSEAVKSLTKDQITIINQDVSIIMFYSSRTAEIFFNLSQKYKFFIDNKIAICISEKCAQHISHLKWKDIKIANYPNEDNMMELL